MDLQKAHFPSLKTSLSLAGTTCVSRNVAFDTPKNESMMFCSFEQPFPATLVNLWGLDVRVENVKGCSVVVVVSSNRVSVIWQWRVCWVGGSMGHLGAIGRATY